MVQSLLMDNEQPAHRRDDIAAPELLVERGQDRQAVPQHEPFDVLPPVLREGMGGLPGHSPSPPAGGETGRGGIMRAVDFGVRDRLSVDFHGREKFRRFGPGQGRAVNAVRDLPVGRSRFFNGVRRIQLDIGAPIMMFGFQNQPILGFLGHRWAF
jgi:hypothetical protein